MQPHKLLAFSLILFTSLLTPGLVSASHKISFSLIETQTVENDLLVVEFSAEHQAKTHAEVTQLINQSMQQALQQLSQAQRQLVQTGNFSVYPRYNKEQQISHWQGQQNLTAKIPQDIDFADILTKLQTSLIYKSMHGEVSATKRQQVEQQLLSQALQNYQAKAKTLAAEFGSKSAKLVETHILNLGAGQRPQARAMLMAADSAPNIEMGEQDLSVQINGVLKVK